MATTNLSVGIKTDGIKPKLGELRKDLENALKGINVSINEASLVESIKRAASKSTTINLGINKADLIKQISSAISEAGVQTLKVNVDASGGLGSTTTSILADINKLTAKIKTEMTEAFGGKGVVGSAKKAGEDAGKQAADGFKASWTKTLGSGLSIRQTLTPEAANAVAMGPSRDLLEAGMVKRMEEAIKAQDKWNRLGAAYGPTQVTLTQGLFQQAQAQQKLNEAGAKYGPTAVTLAEGIAKQAQAQQKLNEEGAKYGPNGATLAAGLAKQALAQQKLNEEGAKYGPTATTLAEGIAKQALAQQKLNEEGAKFGPTRETLVGGLAQQAQAEENLAKRRAAIQVNSAKLNDQQLGSVGRQASFFQDIQNQLNSAENAGRGLDKRITSYENFVNRIRKLQAELSASGENVFRAKRGDDTTNLVMQGTGGAEARIAALRREVELRKENARVERELRDQRKGGKSVVDDFGNLITVGGQAAETIRSVGSTSSSTAAQKAKLKEETKAVSEATKHHREQQAMLHSTLRGVAGGLDNLWLTYGRYVGHMIGAYAAVSVARKSVEKGIDFDYQTRFVAALGNDSSDNAYKGIQQGLYGIKDAPANVNELARSLRVLQQTGIDASEGLGLLKTVISASTLGESDMKTAAEDVVGVLEVFNMHSKDPDVLAANFKKAGDIMAYVSQETKANLHDVATSFQAATGIAEQYGVSIEFAAGVMTALGKQGIVASKAGTFTRNFIEEMYQPKSGKAEKALKGLGVSAYNKDGSARKELEVTLDLVKKLEKYNASSKDSFVADIFGERGAKAFRAISADLPGFIKSMEEAAASTGLLDKQTEKLAKSTQYQLNQLSAEFSNLLTKTWNDESLAKPIEDLRKALGDGNLQGLLTDLVGGLVKLTTAVASNIDVIIGLGKAMASFGAFQVAAGAVTLLRTAFIGLAGVVAPAGGVLLAASGAMGPTITGATGLRAAVAALPAAFAALSVPMTAVIGVLAGVGAAFYLFRDRTVDAMQQSTQAVRENARDIAKLLGEIEENIDNVPISVSKASLNASRQKLKNDYAAIVDDEKVLRDKFKINNKSQAEEVVRQATTTNSTGDVYTDESPKYKAAVAYLDKLKLVDSQREKHIKLSAQLSDMEDAEVAKESARQKEQEKLLSRIGGGGKPDKEANKLENARIKNILKELSTAESMYDSYYDRLIKMENAAAEAGLITREQAETRVTAITKEQLDTRVALNQDFTKRIDDTVKASKNLSGSNKEALEGELERRTQLIFKLEQELRLTQEIARIKSEGTEKKFNETLTKSRSDIYGAAEKRTKDVTGKTEDPVAKARAEANKLVDDQYRDQIRKAREELEALKNLPKNLEDLEAEAAAGSRVTRLENEIDQMKSAWGQYYADLATWEQSAEAGWERYWNSYSNNALTAAKTVENAMSSMTNNLTSEIMNFAQTGEFNWKKMANAIFTDLAKMQLQFMVSKIFNPESKAVGGAQALFELVSGNGPKKPEMPGVGGAGTPAQQALESVRTSAGDASTALAEFARNLFGTNQSFGTLGATTNQTAQGVQSLAGSTQVASQTVTGMGSSATVADASLASTASSADSAANYLFRMATSPMAGVAAGAAGGTGGSGLWGMAAGMVANYFVPGSGTMVSGLVNAGVGAYNGNYMQAAQGLAGAYGGYQSYSTNPAIEGSKNFVGPPRPSAKGNSFDSASMIKAFAKGDAFSNSILTSPTLFKYADGGSFSMGVAGEAGPEAVMPLARDNQGRLGVRYTPMQSPSQFGKTTEPPPPPQNNIRIVNAFDTAVIGDFMGSTEGEKVIMNAVKRNQATIKRMTSA